MVAELHYTALCPCDLLLAHHQDQYDEDEFLAVGEGLVRITRDSVAVLTDMAVATFKEATSSAESFSFQASFGALVASSAFA